MSLFDDASLVLIPDGAKDGTLYSVKPTDGTGDFTFTRGSNLAATRVDENGLIEKGRENLLLQSNTFSTTWTNSDTTETSGQSGYDGLTDAWKIDKSAASGYITQSISQNSVQTFSVYAKAGTLDWIRLVAVAGTDQDQYFDLSTGALGATGTNIDAVIESVGSGWYRCSIALSQSVTSVRIYPADDDNDVSGTSGNIYIQDAQLEQGLVATDYIETGATTAQAGILEDMPRLDYSGGATCPSLLLEPSRTQLVGQSEYFDGSYWPKADVTIENNATTSPQGKLNASKFVASATNANHLLNKTGFLSVTSGDKYTFSIFAKAAEYDFIRLQFQTGAFPVNYANFDLTNGTIGLNTGATDTKIESVGNGWYKCVLVVTATSTGNSGLQPFVLDSDRTGTSPSYLGDGTSGIYIWGAQCEQASYPTSYIPTYGSSVTRSVDSCVKTGISSLIGQTEGTLFFDVDLNNIVTGQSQYIGVVSDGTASNRIQLLKNLNDQWQLFITADTISSNISILENTSGTGRYKLAVAYQSGDVVLYINGVQENTSSETFTFGTLTDFDLGQRYDDDFVFENPIRQALVFKTRLSNTQLAALTTI